MRHSRTIHGYKRSYLKTGQGPALLLLHGIGDSSEAWRELMPVLAEDHTVIAPDLLGHGRSAKPRADYSVAAYANGMRDLLSVLDVDRVTVVGHSLGGGVAAQFAYQFPERCERLVLVACGGVARDVSPTLRVATLPMAEVVLPLLGLPGSKLATRAIAEVLKRTPFDLACDAGEIERVLAGLPSGAARRAFVRTLRSAVDWKGQVITMLDRTYLASAVPTMLVWGERDAIIPVAHAHLAHDAMPGSRLELFEDAGHFPHHHDPERFVAVLRDFLATTGPARYEPDAWRALLANGPAEQPEPASAVEDLAFADRTSGS
jgi:pimeloyl-ACP methyl ester carboxylesterase